MFAARSESSGTGIPHLFESDPDTAKDCADLHQLVTASYEKLCTSEMNSPLITQLDPVLRKLKMQLAELKDVEVVIVDDIGKVHNPGDDTKSSKSLEDGRRVVKQLSKHGKNKEVNLVGKFASIISAVELKHHHKNSTSSADGGESSPLGAGKAPNSPSVTSLFVIPSKLSKVTNSELFDHSEISVLEPERGSTRLSGLFGIGTPETKRSERISK